MKRIAIVTPRCHETLVGGAEELAWQYALLLAGHYALDVLTTTASDYVNWTNDLPEGVQSREGITIRRFSVARGRGAYFHDLHERLLAHFASTQGAAAEKRVRWTEALQEEFIRAQGPLCPGLIEYITEHGDEYAALIFVTYLYPTTFDGVRAVTHRRWAIVPTLHDEAPAYFSAFASMGRRAPRLLWNTRAEKRLGKVVWEVDAGEIVSMPIATEVVSPAHEAGPYLLYCGRIDSHKGCALLIAAFESYKAAHPSPLRLLLTGVDKLGVRESAHVRYLGFVDAARKSALMAGAAAFVHPSSNESLGIVALEAMAQGVPIIVNGDCDALVEHVASSGSGYLFRGPLELHAAIDAVLALDSHARAEQGERAHAYVSSHYGRDTIRARLIEEVAALSAL